MATNRGRLLGGEEGRQEGGSCLPHRTAVLFNRNDKFAFRTDVNIERQRTSKIPMVDKI